MLKFLSVSCVYGYETNNYPLDELLAGTRILFFCLDGQLGYVRQLATPYAKASNCRGASGYAFRRDYIGDEKGP